MYFIDNNKVVLEGNTKDTYKNVTYYRYRDRNYVKTNTEYKWSVCNNEVLIKEGYKNTGKTR